MSVAVPLRADFPGRFVFRWCGPSAARGFPSLPRATCFCKKEFDAMSVEDASCPENQIPLVDGDKNSNAPASPATPVGSPPDAAAPVPTSGAGGAQEGTGREDRQAPPQVTLTQEFDMTNELNSASQVRTGLGNDQAGTEQEGNLVLPSSSPPVGASQEVDAAGQTNQLTVKEEMLLDKLEGLWRQQEARGLATRHEMGKLLNAQLGDPTKRQPRDQWVLKGVSVRLKIAESDLSRMRWFAHLFKEYEGLKQRHPEVGSWSQLKKLLPTLKVKEQASGNGQSGVKPAGQSPPKTPNRAVGKVKRPLGSLTRAIQEHATTLNNTEERNALVRMLKEFAKVLEEKLQIRLSVTLPRKPTRPTPAAGDDSAGGDAQP